MNLIKFTYGVYVIMLWGRFTEKFNISTTQLHLNTNKNILTYSRHTLTLQQISIQIFVGLLNTLVTKKKFFVKSSKKMLFVKTKF